MAQKRIAPVSLSALMARINRKLAPDFEKIKKTRSERAFLDLGEYYVVDLNRNAIVAKDLDVEEYGRKLGVLQPWEALAK